MEERNPSKLTLPAEETKMSNEESNCASEHNAEQNPYRKETHDERLVEGNSRSLAVGKFGKYNVIILRGLGYRTSLLSRDKRSHSKATHDLIDKIDVVSSFRLIGMPKLVVVPIPLLLDQVCSELRLWIIYMERNSHNPSYCEVGSSNKGVLHNRTDGERPADVICQEGSDQLSALHYTSFLEGRTFQL